MSVALELTPYKYALMLLIKDFVLSDVSHDGDMVTKFRLGSLLASLTRLDDGFVEKSLPALIENIHSNVGREANSITIANRLMTELDQIESPDDVFHHMQSLTNNFFDEQANEQTVFEGSSGLALVSLLGVFQRRLSLGFVCMTFEAVAQLFDDIKAYYNAFFEDPLLRAAADVRDVESSQSTNSMYAEFNPVLPFEAQAIESGIHGQSYQSIAKKLLILREHAPNVGRLHYLLHINALLHRQYDAARISLYRYYDAAVPVPLKTTFYEQATSATRKKRGRALAYAALALARTHVTFGNVGAARRALREAGRIAQERDDEACLAFVLYWLARLDGTTDGQPAARRLLLHARQTALVHQSDDDLVCLIDLQLACMYAARAPRLRPLWPTAPPAARAAAASGDAPTHTTLAASAIARHLFRARVANAARPSNQLSSTVFAASAQAWWSRGLAELSRSSTMTLYSDILMHAGFTSDHRNIDFDRGGGSGPHAKQVDAYAQSLLISLEIAQNCLDWQECEQILQLLMRVYNCWDGGELKEPLASLSSPAHGVQIVRKAFFETRLHMLNEGFYQTNHVAFEKQKYKSILKGCEIATGNLSNEVENIDRLKELKDLLIECDELLKNGSNNLALFRTLKACGIANAIGTPRVICDARMRLVSALLVNNRLDSARRLAKSLSTLLWRHRLRTTYERCMVLLARIDVAEAACGGERARALLLGAVDRLKRVLTSKSARSLTLHREIAYELTVIYDRLGMRTKRNKAALLFKQINETLC